MGNLPIFRLIRLFIPLLTSVAAFQARALPDVHCDGFLLKRSTQEFIKQPLKQYPDDKNFYRTDILHYGIGADFFFLSTGGLGLVIFNNNTNQATSAQVGFHRVGETKTFTADLKMYDVWPDGQKVVAGVQCYYDEP
jgi:hypothetical protein